MGLRRATHDASGSLQETWAKRQWQALERQGFKDAVGAGSRPPAPPRKYLYGVGGDNNLINPDYILYQQQGPRRPPWYQTPLPGGQLLEESDELGTIWRAEDHARTRVDFISEDPQSDDPNDVLWVSLVGATGGPSKPFVAWSGFNVLIAEAVPAHLRLFELARDALAAREDRATAAGEPAEPYPVSREEDEFRVTFTAKQPHESVARWHTPALIRVALHLGDPPHLSFPKGSAEFMVFLDTMIAVFRSAADVLHEQVGTP